MVGTRFVARRAFTGAFAATATALLSLAALPSDAQVGSFCPSSAASGGVELSAAFAGNDESRRVLRYGRRALIRGRVLDAEGNGVAGATVCIEDRTRAPGWDYRLAGLVTTHEDGSWAFELPSGASRSIAVSYRDGLQLKRAELALEVRAHATLHLSRHRTRTHRRVHFWGRIPGPLPAKRVVIICGTVPGARRKFLVRRAKTDVFGHFRAAYAFSRVPTLTKFVFWALVPEQNGYPYMLGRSASHYIRVGP